MSTVTRGGNWSDSETAPGVDIPSVAEATDDELRAAMVALRDEHTRREVRRLRAKRAAAMLAGLDDTATIWIGNEAVGLTPRPGESAHDPELWRALAGAIRPVLEAAAAR